MNILSKVAIAALLAVGLSVASGQSNSKKDNAFAGEKVIGKKEVTAAIAITDIPESLAVFKKSGFSKYVSVFGIHMLATPTARDEKILHAAKVMAEYMDNDSDGIPDNMLVMSHLLSRKAFLIFPRTPDEMESMDRGAWREAGFSAGQSQWDEETHPGFIVDGVLHPEVGHDASIEEVFHLLCSAGWASAYPEVFGFVRGTAIAKCMDTARAGYYEEPPTGGPRAGYPAEAWYSYDDTTCNYACMIIEYMYWGMSSILGAQDYPERARQISPEWLPYNKKLMAEMETCLYGLLMDPKFKLPMKAPEGRYAPSSTPTVTVPIIEVTENKVEPS